MGIKTIKYYYNIIVMASGNSVAVLIIIINYVLSNTRIIVHLCPFVNCNVIIIIVIRCAHNG